MWPGRTPPTECLSLGLLPVHEALAFGGSVEPSLDPHPRGPAGVIGPEAGTDLFGVVGCGA